MSLPHVCVWGDSGGATLKTAAKETNKRLAAKLPKFGLRTHTVALDFGQWRSLPFCLPSLITSAIIITVPYFHNKRKTKYLFRRAIRLRSSCSCLRFNPVDELPWSFFLSFFPDPEWHCGRIYGAHTTGCTVFRPRGRLGLRVPFIPCFIFCNLCENKEISSCSMILRDCLTEDIIHFHLYSLSAVHSYDLYHVHTMSFSSYNGHKLNSHLTASGESS